MVGRDPLTTALYEALEETSPAACVEAPEIELAVIDDSFNWRELTRRLRDKLRSQGVEV